MALLLAAICILGNKHKARKSIAERINLITLMTAVLAYSLVPQVGLAFEVDYTQAPAKKLIAQVQILHSEDFQDGADVVREPEYTQRMAGSVTASSIVETKSGDWRSRKLASVSSKPYTATRVLPQSGTPVVLQGEASYYSRAGCLGCNPLRIMANGQPLNDNALTMAIGADRKHLVGYRAKVTNVNSGQSVDVLITDTGGFYQGKYGNRVADLTIATKQAIGISGGLGQVKVEVY
jgi:rare lipoprotein A (peptidoglycan hydrolase)